MATIADELLADFDDSGEEGLDEPGTDGLFPDNGDAPTGLNGFAPRLTGNAASMELDGDEEGIDSDEDMADMAGSMEVEDDEEVARAKIDKMQLKGVQDVRSVAGLMKTLEPVLERIAHYKSLPPEQQTSHVGTIEDNPEYHLLTQSNTLSTSIDNEIMIVHKYIRDHYSVRFPELETLVSNPLDYARVVTIIGNGPMDGETIKALQNSKDNALGASLRQVLDGPSVMIVTVEATTSKGRDMSEAETQRVHRACDMLLALDKAKTTLTEYVQSRMNLFAPNLTALIGSLTAAQLLNVSGGLTGLAKTPACNLAALGSKKQAGQGMATNVGIRQQGFLYHSPIVKGIPSDLKRQAMRIVSAKVVLAARIDRVHSSPNGAAGDELRDGCITRLEKLTEAPANKGARALPAPDDKLARKRGGRRARKAKEATAMTDLRKAQNRMAFGKEEKEAGYGTGEGTIGMGMIGAANDGRIRNIQIDQRTKAKLSKNNKGWGAATPVGGAASSIRGFGQAPGAMDLRGKGLRSSGIGTSLGGTNGTASTIAFTPVQGLELVDPKKVAELNRKRKAEDDRWFKGGTFTQVGGASTDGGMGPPPAKKANTSMGPPALPHKKS